MITRGKNVNKFAISLWLWYKSFAYMTIGGIENLRGVFAPPIDAGTQQTPEAEPFEYELKELAQQCLENDLHIVGDNTSNRLRDIERSIKAVREHYKYQRNVPHLRIAEQLVIEMSRNFFPHVEVAFMLVNDHNFFQGKNEKDRWSDTDKRYLLDAALEENIAFHEGSLAKDRRMQAYYSRRGFERETGEDTFRYLVQRDRQIQSKLRQRVPPTTSRIKFR